jgi:hypothetical protein
MPIKLELVAFVGFIYKECYIVIIIIIISSSSSSSSSSSIQP